MSNTLSTTIFLFLSILTIIHNKTNKNNNKLITITTNFFIFHQLNYITPLNLNKEKTEDVFSLIQIIIPHFKMHINDVMDI